MSLPPVVSAAEWDVARAELLAKEKEATRLLDALAARRRRLPVTPFGADYTFEGPAGAVNLLALFEGRRQLVVYQMMDNGPDDYCSGCANFVDNVGNLAHLRQRDTVFAVVSDMPWSQLAAYWRRMGWQVPVYSSRGTSFSDDTGTGPGQGFGLTVFLRDGRDVYRSYFTNARGVDRLRIEANLLDLTPYGRQETWEDSPPGWPQSPPYEWWRLHDEYAQRDG